jgi:aminomethyltransferase
MAKLTDANLVMVKSYWFTHGTVCGFENVLIGRTGYTGEDGFEIYLPSDEATSAMVWNAVLEAGKEWGVIPCGLGARNTLRLEAKMPLYDHEISDTINVWEAGLERYCKVEKPEFIGREALLQAKAAGPDKVLAGLEMTGRGIARDGYRVLDLEGAEIGYATSGSPAPFLKKNIALVYVPPAFAAVGTDVRVEVRGQGVAAQIVATPFYKRPKV